MSTLFYTAADKKYEFFVPLYIYFTLSFNTEDCVEIVLENADYYKRKNSDQLRTLSLLFKDRFILRTADFNDKLPSVIRFITEPLNEHDCRNVYIGDIDILILESEIEKRHLANMKKNEIPFSNIVRSNLKGFERFPRLSGLHFAPIKTQYPLPNISDLDTSNKNTKIGADEHILYQLMKRKGYILPYIQKSYFRPEHGIHVSLNRSPYGDSRFAVINGKKIFYEWSGLRNNQYQQLFLQHILSKKFASLYPHLDIRAKNLINIIENACLGRFDEYKKEMKKIFGFEESYKKYLIKLSKILRIR